jgi:hypothetical protein
MDCYAGSASEAKAAKCQDCGAGVVCPAGTSLDELGQEMVKSTGILQLDGITVETFKSAKANIIQAIKQSFLDRHNVSLADNDIQLSGSNARRALSAGFMLQFTVQIASNAKRNSATPSTTNMSSAPASGPTSVIAIDAAAVSQLVIASMQSDEIAKALNVTSGALIATSIGKPSQEKSKKGDCPAGAYVVDGMGECTSCAPGRAAPKGSFTCSNCNSGTYAKTAGYPECLECLTGFYQEEDEGTMCLKCRPNALTVGTGAISVQECVCEPGYFDCTTAGAEICKLDECNECPFHASCDQAETLESLQAKRGFWRAVNHTNVFHQCPNLDACKGGRIHSSNRDSQCNVGYVGVRCELCDYESGYAIHRPSNKCSKCKKNEGQHSVYLAAGVMCGLLLLFAATQLRLWPRWLSRVKKVTVLNGQHAGRSGRLTCSHCEVDELNDAFRAAGTLHVPINPPSGFEQLARCTLRAAGTLFSKSRSAELQWRAPKEELRQHWASAEAHVRTQYENRVQQQRGQYDRKHAKYFEARALTYTVLLRKNGEHEATNVCVLGADLRLCTMDLQEMYQLRVTKIKITVQFVQICLRLSGTYRFPLPPLTIEFLSYIKYLEVFDIAQIPMNLDCWQHFNYINNAYVHTLTCLLVMALLKLKQGAVLSFAMLLYKRLRWSLGRAETDGSGLKKRSKVYVAPVTQDLNQRHRIPQGRRRRRRSSITSVADARRDAQRSSVLNQAEAANLIQAYWGSTRVRAARRNIDVLRRSLLSSLSTAKHLGTEDFFLLFSYAVYSSLCDTCFMYFDCSPYEDGEMYLTADVSIKCEGPDAGSYIASLGYVSFMSALFAVGIPLYYVLALKEVRHAIMPPLQSILKDRDYVAAFALGGLRLLDEEGTEMKGTQLRSAQQVAGCKTEVGAAEPGACCNSRWYRLQIAV